MILTDADQLREALRVALAERDEARAEVERLSKLENSLPASLRDAHAVVEELRARLRAVAERQREADRKAFSMWLREVHAAGFPHETPEVLAIAVDAGEMSLPLVTDTKADGGSP